jgi:hypothetical protein
MSAAPLIPTVDGIRERILVEVDRLSEAYDQAIASGSHRLEWLTSEQWIDPRRMIVIPDSVARELGASAPEQISSIRDDQLELRGGRRSIISPDQLCRLLAFYVIGIPYIEMSQAFANFMIPDFINYTVVQPRVNPAFAPLFWIAGARDFSQFHVQSRDLGDSVGAMAYDMVAYPDSLSLSERASVRTAQIEFVRAGHVNLGNTDWQRASDQEWAEFCWRAFHRFKAADLFFAIQTKARRAIEEHEEREDLARRPKDELVEIERGRFCFGPFTLVVPPTWAAQIGGWKISLPGAEPQQERVLLLMAGDSDPRTWMNYAYGFVRPDGQPAKLELVDCELAGQQGSIGTVEGRFEFEGEPPRDHRRVFAIVPSPIGWYEIRLQGDPEFVAKHEAAFRGLLASLKLRDDVVLEP